MPTSRRGVTMMETVIGTLLVGGVLAGTLSLVGPTARSSQLAGDVTVASYLASELLSEIEAQPFEDPTEVDRVMGPEPGESSGGQRALFDDVDDYAGWSGAPQSSVGVETTGLNGTWLISVKVVFVEPGDPASESGTDTGVKRITVTVSRDGSELQVQSVLRSRSFDTAWGGA